MKKVYQKPEVEIIHFDFRDMITASCECPYPYDPNHGHNHNNNGHSGHHKP